MPRTHPSLRNDARKKQQRRAVAEEEDEDYDDEEEGKCKVLVWLCVNSYSFFDK